MSIPVPPTDNLYKFMAISGLLMIAFSAYYPMQRYADLQLKQVSTQTEVELAGLEAGEIHKVVLHLSSERPVDAKALDSVGARNDESGRNLIRLDGLVKKQRILLFQLRIVGLGAAIGLIFGLIISVMGFKLWYLRVQRIADAAALKK